MGSCAGCGSCASCLGNEESNTGANEAIPSKPIVKSGQNLCQNDLDESDIRIPWPFFTQSLDLFCCLLMQLCAPHLEMSVSFALDDKDQPFIKSPCGINL